MNVLDFFSGRGGFSRAFRERGHDVFTVDSDQVFGPTVVADVRQLRWPVLDLPHRMDVVLASPPCEKFSVAAIGRYWRAGGKPGVPEPEVVDALGLVATTLRLVAEIAPSFWVMENPTGMLRTVIGPPRERVYLCSFGARWKKPTDLWGVWPGRIRRPCGPHEPAARGSKHGVQAADDPSERAELPYGLGEELCIRIEDVLAGRPVDPSRSMMVDRELPPTSMVDRGRPVGVADITGFP